MVGNEHNLPRPVIVEVWEGNLMLSADGLSYDNLRNVVEFVPVFVLFVNVTVQWLELRTTWNSNIQCLSSEE